MGGIGATWTKIFFGPTNSEINHLDNFFVVNDVQSTPKNPNYKNKEFHTDIIRHCEYIIKSVDQKLIFCYILVINLYFKN